MNSYSAPWQRGTPSGWAPTACSSWHPLCQSSLKNHSSIDKADFRGTIDGHSHGQVVWGGSELAEENQSETVDGDQDSLDVGVARSRVEALLLIAKSPLNYRKIASLAGLEDATQARTLVNQLNELYDSQNRGFRIEQIAGGSRMMTRSVVAPWLRRLGVLAPAIRLSWPMMETLAVVAYRQDVTRADVESVRGVACGEILRQLMQLDLVRISGRSDDLGRPYLYGTTKRFLKICGLASINALPAIDSRGFCDDLSGSQEFATRRDDSDLSPTTDSVFDAESQVLKESDVSLAVTDALATDSVLSHFATGVAGVHDASADGPRLATLASDADAANSPRAVIEDEEDERFESGLDDDDDFVDVEDDEDDDWDDDDEDEDEDEDDDEDEDEDDVEDDFEAEEESEDDSWEEVDDDDADEDWEDEDDEDDDWDDDDEEEEDDI